MSKDLSSGQLRGQLARLRGSAQETESAPDVPPRGLPWLEPTRVDPRIRPQ
jgi:hypothetical protein